HYFSPLVDVSVTIRSRRGRVQCAFRLSNLVQLRSPRRAPLQLCCFGRGSTTQRRGLVLFCFSELALFAPEPDAQCAPSGRDWNRNPANRIQAKAKALQTVVGPGA